MRVVRRSLHIVSVVFFATVIAVYGWGLIVTSGPLPDHCRNSTANVARIRTPESGPWHFAVLGDPEDGLDLFERCLDRMKRNPPAFVVILGDVIHYAQPWSYQYFLHRFRGAGFDIPVFPAVGNHDITWWRLTRRGQYEYYWRYFGSENFAFVHRNSLFVLLDNANGSISKETRRWLEEVLESRHRTVDHIFLFAHCPVVRYTEEGTVDQPPGPVEDSAMYELCRAYPIRYFCAAHLHSYRRAVLESGTIHLVSGAGGADHDGVDAFDHYVEMEIDGPRVTDRVVKVEPLGFVRRAKQDTQKVLLRDTFLRLRCERQWEFALLAISVLWLLTLRLRAMQRKREVTPPRGNS